MTSAAAAMTIPGVFDRAKAGSRSAFETIVAEQGGLVFSIAYHFLSNASLAEEIAQDVFLELFRTLPKLQSPEHLLSWLRRTTTHRCIDLSRKSAYKSERPLLEDVHPASAGRDADPLLRESLRKQVAALPEWQRAVVILRYQEDLSIEEISATLNIPANTVKSRLYRATESLRSALQSKRMSI